MYLTVPLLPMIGSPSSQSETTVLSSMDLRSTVICRMYFLPLSKTASESSLYVMLVPPLRVMFRNAVPEGTVCGTMMTSLYLTLPSKKSVERSVPMDMAAGLPAGVTVRALALMSFFRVTLACTLVPPTVTSAISSCMMPSLATMATCSLDSW